MRLTYLSIQNYMQISHLEINFDEWRGQVVVVVGENGVGKSTILSSILWCLTGKDGRASTLADDVVKWGSKGGVVVTTHWETSGGRILRVQRSRKHPIHKTSLHFQWGDMHVEEGGQMQQKEEMLFSALGVKEKVVRALLTFPQGGLGLLGMENKELSSLLRECAGVEVWQDLEGWITAQSQAIKGELAESIRWKDHYQGVTQEMGLVAQEEASYAGADAMSIFYAGLFNACAYVGDTLYREEKATTQREIQRLQQEIRVMQDRQRQAEALTKEDRCFHCGQSMTKASYRTHIQTHLAELQASKTQLEASLLDQEARLQAFARVRDRWMGMTQRLGGVQRNLALYVTGEKTRTSRQIELEKKTKQAREKLAEVEEKTRGLQDSEASLTHWKEWARRVQVQCSGLFFSGLHADLLHSLEQFFPGQDVQMQVGHAVLADGTPRFEKLALDVRWEGREVGVGNLSGGQCRRLSIAFQKALLSTTPLRTLLFDEWFTDLDDASTQVVWSYLKQLALSHTVLVVSHKGEWLDPTLRLHREKGEIRMTKVGGR